MAGHGLEETSWARFGHRVGWLTGAALVAGTGLYLLDALDVLDPSPSLQPTAAGFEHDLASYYAAWFAHQHRILWSIALREVAFLVAFAGLALLVVALVRQVGWRRPAPVVAAVLIGLGAALHSVADFTFLGNSMVWRNAGWGPEPASNMIAAGRAAEAIGGVSDLVEVASYLLLFAGLVAVVVAVRTWRPAPGALTAAAMAEAIGILALGLGIATETDGLQQVGGLVSGLIAGPAFAVLLGRSASTSAEVAAAPVA